MRLHDRKRQVLCDLIDEFLKTGAPVGSRVVAARSDRRVSPATVRSVMAELTHEGYLEQPHTSAGRIPTERALRLYIDELLDVNGLSPQERQAIEVNLETVTTEENRPLQGVARLLSDLTNQAGLLLTEGFDAIRLQRIEFVRVASRRVLVILITVHGLVHERLLITEEDFSSPELQRFANFLNEQTDGCTLSELRKRLERKRKQVGQAARVLVEHAIRLATTAMETLPSEGELHVEGQAHIAASEEFLRSGERLRELLEVLEDGKHMSALLSRIARGEGVQVLIGEEAGLGSLPVSLVAAPCRALDSAVVGTVGILGPTRMNYSRAISLVSYLAGLAGSHYGGDGRNAGVPNAN